MYRADQSGRLRHRPAGRKLLWNFGASIRPRSLTRRSCRATWSMSPSAPAKAADLIRAQKSGEAFTAELVYGNKNMTNHHGNTLLLDGHVYGFSEGKGWMCQPGQRRDRVVRANEAAGWLADLADGRSYCYSEDDGTVALSKPAPLAGRKPAGSRFRSRAISASPAARSGRRRLSPAADCFCGIRSCCFATTLRTPKN